MSVINEEEANQEDPKAEETPVNNNFRDQFNDVKIKVWKLEITERIDQNVNQN